MIWFLFENPDFYFLLFQNIFPFLSVLALSEFMLSHIFSPCYTFLRTVHYGNTGCGVFLRGGTKLERFLHKNQHTQRKLLNFEEWVNGEMSNIGHQFRK